MLYLDIFGFFGLQFRKRIVIFEISTVKFIKLQSLIKNNITLKHGPKISSLDIFKLEFEKTIVIFEFSIFEFVKFRNYKQKKKSSSAAISPSNFSKCKVSCKTKQSLWIAILKNCCYICNQRP